ncbi:uncharacterized protein V1513DRAFT_400133 [Lipomyces chichibuensis]|uniref:uncharacterized protein n=1 Tax=Lipomyces chichibuensis TaxID=1546026 RepID=UPI0033440C99
MASPSRALLRYSKSDYPKLPFASSGSLLSSIPLPSADVSDEALASFLHQIETARACFEELRVQHDIRLVAADAEGLVLVEKQFAKLKSHLDFLQLRTSDGNHTHGIGKDILSVVYVIENSLRKSREQVDIALEWSELHDSVMADLESVMKESQILLAELQQCQRTHDIIEEDRLEDALDVDMLMTSLKQSPVPGHGKLINLRDTDEIQNSKLCYLCKKMQPLRVSLDLLDAKMGDMIPRLVPFPDAHQDLVTRRAALDTKWKKLSFDADKIKREMGEDRWTGMLAEACNQARKLMTEIDHVMNDLEDVHENGHDDITIKRHKELYEQKAGKIVPEILKILGLLSRAMEDKLTINGDIKREHLHFTNFWNNLDERMRGFDEKYDLDVRTKVGLTGGRESRSSMRSFVSSNCAYVVELNFRGSRSRSRTSAHSNTESNSPGYLSPSSSPFDEEPHLQTPTVARKAKENDLCTPHQTRPLQSSSLSIRSVSPGQLRSLKAPPSAIPIRKRPSITPELFTEPSSLTRARTPSTGHQNTKRRVSCIPQPKFTTLEVDIPPIPAIPPSTASQHQKLHELGRTASMVDPTTPTRKQSQVFSNSVRTAKAEKEKTIMSVSQSAKRPLISAPTSTSKIAKATTTLPKSRTPAHTSQRTPKIRTVSSRDPFGPPSIATLNHHVSTPNLSSLAKKPSRANLIAQDGKASVPPVPAFPPQTPLKTAAKAYKIPTGLSPDSQQKYYIKYGSPTTVDATGSAEDAHILAESAGNSTKKTSVRKSMGTVKEKPRWR